MATPKICGIETEYGIIVTGMEMSPMTASSLLVNAYTDDGLSLRAWDFAHERPDMDARTGWNPSAEYPEVEMLMANSVLSNGARFYVDHAHPEISTPECKSIRDVVLYDRASEEIIRQSLSRANTRLPDGVEMRLYKNNSDGKGNSYGCHENYLVSRLTPFGALSRLITTHFVTRQIFTGAGKVGVEQPREGEPRISYQISQRADFFEETVGLETTVRRPIVNTRDEPHCDPSQWRRLHVIVGDANMSEFATFLKLGSTAIVLGMIEDGVLPDSLVVKDPVTEIRRVSHDTSLQHALQMEDGSFKTALEVQYELLEHATQWLASLDEDPLGGDSQEIVEMWGDVLIKLDSNPESLADTIDWIAKRRILEAMRQRHGLNWDHPRLKAIDLQYHDMNEERGLFSKLGIRTMCSTDEIFSAMCEPPVDTRAFFRGKCISKWPQSVSSANWDSVVFDVGEPTLQRIPMMDPLKGTRMHVGQLLQDCTTVNELLTRLSHDVEQVVDDPGW